MTFDVGKPGPKSRCWLGTGTKSDIQKCIKVLQK